MDYISTLASTLITHYAVLKRILKSTKLTRKVINALWWPLKQPTVVNLEPWTMLRRGDGAIRTVTGQMLGQAIENSLWDPANSLMNSVQP
jgi:hypothetical protein